MVKEGTFEKVLLKHLLAQIEEIHLENIWKKRNLGLENRKTKRPAGKESWAMKSEHQGDVHGWRGIREKKVAEIQGREGGPTL